MNSKVKWYCRRHECGHLIIANLDGAEFAGMVPVHHHEPWFAFWNTVESLARSVHRFKIGEEGALREDFERDVRDQCEIQNPEDYRMGDSYSESYLALRWRWYKLGSQRRK